MNSTKTQQDSSTVMDELFTDCPMPKIFKIGELIKGIVINKKKNCILVDINGVSTGIITGKEIKDTANTAKTVQVDDIIEAVVIENENDDGFITLSLRASSNQKSWDQLEESFKKGDTLKIKAKEANKGGLLIDIEGIVGFLPVSQLAPLHYPRVNDADTSRILQKLQALIGIDFEVKIIAMDKNEKKLIFSEKEIFKDAKSKEMMKLKVGDKVKGRISGIVKFGIFVTFNQGLEGLVHISEINWGHVANPENFGKVGDEIDALVIGVEKDKISLSIKQLSADPWIEASKKIKLGEIIKGKINRLSDFGAFLKIDDQINGLIHLSEIFNKDGTIAKKPEDVLKVGD